MQAWDRIQSTLDWIEENLPERIEIENLAASAQLSPFYYQRLFSRLVGKPIMEYIKLRRLANAADYLVGHKSRIIDVALDFGFENHETFTRAFKDAYGMTPEKYRAGPRQLSHFNKPDLSLKYCLVDENVPLVSDGIILEVRREWLDTPRCFAGFSVQNPVNDTPGVDFLGELWDRFHREKHKVLDLLTGGNELGVSYCGTTDGFFTYFAGAEVSGQTEQPGFEYWAMPEGRYNVCSFEAENFYLLTTNALNKARDYMLGVWLKNNGVTIEPFMAELYFDTSPDGTRMELWFKEAATAKVENGEVCASSEVSE